MAEEFSGLLPILRNPADISFEGLVLFLGSSQIWYQEGMFLQCQIGKE